MSKKVLLREQDVFLIYFLSGNDSEVVFNL